MERIVTINKAQIVDTMYTPAIPGYRVTVEKDGQRRYKDVKEPVFFAERRTPKKLARAARRLERKIDVYNIKNAVEALNNGKN